MAQLYEFIHLHRYGAPVEVYSVEGTSVQVYSFREMAPLYKFTHLHRDGAPVQVYSF